MVVGNQYFISLAEVALKFQDTLNNYLLANSAEFTKYAPDHSINNQYYVTATLV